MRSITWASLGLLLAAAFAAAPLSSGAATGIAAPRVTGPIAAVAVGDASHDYPFYASAVDLKARGYVEEEFFFEGIANRYTTPALANGTILDAGHPYKTRLVVRRPAAAERFNGTVLVEWNNVTAGHDLDIDWFQLHDHLIRNGYAWIGVTPQRVGVDALKVWNAKRYGTLDVTQGGAVERDDLSFDIFAAAGAAIKAPGPVDVMGKLKVQRLIATGHSQSASRLATYVNAVHPLAPVFDAVIVHGGGARIREDLTIPVWKLLSETDVIGSQAAFRQPDSKMFRSWEVAGTSHVDAQFAGYSRQLSRRDGSPIAPGGTRAGSGAASTAASAGGNQPGSASSSAAAPAAPPRRQPTPDNAAADGLPRGNCDNPSYSRIPFNLVMNAALEHLVRWLKDGTPPPAAPPIEITTTGPPAVIARDENGNGRGGIRLAEHAVPTAVNTGLNSGPGFCRLNGSYEPFDAATIGRLYPTHAAYIAAVRTATEKNVAAGYILRADGDRTITAAEQATIGTR